MYGSCRESSQGSIPLLETASEVQVPHAVVAGAHERTRAFVTGSAKRIADHRSLSDLASWWRRACRRIGGSGGVIRHLAARLTVLLQKIYGAGSPPVVPRCNPSTSMCRLKHEKNRPKTIKLTACLRCSTLLPPVDDCTQRYYYCFVSITGITDASKGRITSSKN